MRGRSDRENQNQRIREVEWRAELQKRVERETRNNRTEGIQRDKRRVEWSGTTTGQREYRRETRGEERRITQQSSRIERVTGARRHGP